MRCLPSSSSAVVGTTDGALILVDLTTPEQPRPVLKRRLHKGGITALGYPCFLCTYYSMIISIFTDFRSLQIFYFFSIQVYDKLVQCFICFFANTSIGRFIDLFIC